MRKLTTIALLSLLLIAGGKRGIISINAKTKDGKLVPLYSGYYALVIGISDYDYLPDLPNAVKDAEEVGEVLRSLGFKVKILKNPDSDTLKDSLYRFAYSEAGKDRNAAVLIYYAGHGDTIKQKGGKPLGFILPKDTPLKTRDLIGFKKKALSMREFQDIIMTMEAKHIMAIFDSCFSGSIWYLVRGEPLPISEKIKEPTVEFITAGTANEQVPDTSEFKKALILGLKKGYADLNSDGNVTGQELGFYLQDTVVKATGGVQHPQFGKAREMAMSPGDFVFVLRSQPSAYSPQPSAPPPQVNVDFSDLEQRAKIRRQWENYQARMSQAFEKAKSLDRDSSLTPKEKKEAWKRFLSAFSKDNPFSSEDDQMRAYAQKRINYWKNSITEVVIKYAVALKDANVLSMPNVQEGKILYVAKKGERLEILEDLGLWYKIKTNSGIVGYVFYRFFRIEIGRSQR